MDPNEETHGAPPDVPAEVYRTLDSLEDLADFARQRFGHAFSIPMEEFNALMDRLRGGLPANITKAEHLALRAQEILEDARTKSATIASDAQREMEAVADRAQKQAAALIAESPEVRFANAQSRDIIAQAQQAALNVRQDVDAYARETMERLEEYVAKLQNQVRSGIVALDRESKQP
jgi:polyhydroxyalkanoate synthesis regulator phasin